MKCGSGLSSKIYLSYKFTCIVIRFRVKHDLHNKHMYKIMETTVDIRYAAFVMLALIDMLEENIPKYDQPAIVNRMITRLVQRYNHIIDH